MATITIAKYESGERYPPPITAKHLATLLQLQGSEYDRFLLLASARPNRPINLPIMLDSFIERKELRDLLHSWLLRGLIQLVTLKGPPGVGKTRLAIEFAASVRSVFRNGIFFVDLSTITGTEQMIERIAQALLAGDPGDAALGPLQDHDAAPQPHVQRLAATLHSRRVLLVLDNLEQIADVGSDLLHLLHACPDLRLLVTSRRELRITGERVALVPSLAWPSPDRQLTLPRPKPARQCCCLSSARAM